MYFCLLYNDNEINLLNLEYAKYLRGNVIAKPSYVLKNKCPNNAQEIDNIYRVNTGFTQSVLGHSVKMVIFGKDNLKNK